MASIIVYFSRSGENYVGGALRDLPVGNTEIVAKLLHQRTGGELFHLEPVQDYAWDYNTCIDQARADQKRNARPELKAYPEIPEDCDTIYLGYPNYWGTMPMCVFTFLEHTDLTGKTVYPFCTHEGSGMGRSEADIRRLCPGAKIEPGLAIRGSAAAAAGPALDNWLKQHSN